MQQVNRGSTFSSYPPMGSLLQAYIQFRRTLVYAFTTLVYAITMASSHGEQLCIK